MSDFDWELIKALDRLTAQVSRVAYATEQSLRTTDSTNREPCRLCGCTVVPTQTNKCPACGQKAE